MNRIVCLFLCLLLTQLCLAQQQVSVWNSSTGSKVQIFLNSEADPVKVRLLAKGQQPRDYPVSRVSQNWFEYRAGNATMRATFASADEILLKATDGSNSYRWTRQGGKTAYPIPDGDKFGRTYWRTEGSQKKLLLVLSPRACSVMTATPLQGKQSYKAFRAHWTDYPKIMKVEGGQTFRFLNPMLLKSGSTYWYQSHGDYE